LFSTSAKYRDRVGILKADLIRVQDIVRRSQGYNCTNKPNVKAEQSDIDKADAQMRSGALYTGAGSQMGIEDCAAQLAKARANVMLQSGASIAGSAFGEQGKAIQAIGDIKDFDPQSGSDSEQEGSKRKAGEGDEEESPAKKTKPDKSIDHWYGGDEACSAECKKHKTWTEAIEKKANEAIAYEKEVVSLIKPELYDGVRSDYAISRSRALALLLVMTEAEPRAGSGGGSAGLNGAMIASLSASFATEDALTAPIMKPREIGSQLAASGGGEAEEAKEKKAQEAEEEAKQIKKQGEKENEKWRSP
jgi:hypothetical protein